MTYRYELYAGGPEIDFIFLCGFMDVQDSATRR